MKRGRRKYSRSRHRWLGLLAAFPLLWLSVTGLIMNHAERLGFDQREVKAEWILRHYRQLPEGEPVGLKIGDRAVTAWGDFIFLDEELTDLSGELIGAGLSADNLAISTSEKIYVISPTGESLDELDELSLPGVPVQAVGHSGKTLYLKTSDQWWVFGEDLLDYEKADAPESISGLVKLAADEKEKLMGSLKSQGAMPLSRVIQDAHSGKLFGWPGWVISDLTAVSVIVLTLLGLRLVPKRKHS